MTRPAIVNRFLAITWMTLVFLGSATISEPNENKLPLPGIGLFFKPAEVAALRKKIQHPACKPIYQNRILKVADNGLAKWKEDKVKLRIEELAAKLPDLVNFPKEHGPEGGVAAGQALNDHAQGGAPAAAFVFLMTGERKYADYAWDVFEQCAKVNRWGWFPWSGSHLPQIHFGIASRNLMLVADCVWDTLSPAQRQRSRAIIAEKCVEPYYRLVLHTPGIGLYHLRSRNQGSNALAATLVGSLFVGDAVPDNAMWLNSLVQTFHWTITHDIGWMGQGLDPGIGGYWSVSMQNLYTAAAALANVKGIDLRGHPGFEQATWYPIAHESTVPPVGMFTEPIDPTKTPAVMGVIAGQPIELPGGSAMCGPWWFDFAIRFPESPAHYFVSRGMVAKDSLRTTNAHQGTLGEILAIAWWDDRLVEPARVPSQKALFTDRIASLRSGYTFGDTFLYFNSDLFLSAKKEILGTTSGMSWHFPWHQYQITESGIETEGEPYAPSMVIDQASDEKLFTFFRARSGRSNVAYYPQLGQRESYKHYEKRDRSVLYVRGDKGRPDYFLFHDEVKHKEPRWHAWTWHLWDAADNAKNFGRFVVQGERAVRAERPNADLWIEFLTPDKVTVEQHKIPSQPSVSYQMDHNARMMRAIAGSPRKVDAATVAITPADWPGLGVVEKGALYLEKPPTDRPVSSQVVKGLQGGVRYRWSVRCKEQDYRVYEATAWEIDLELLDAAGKVLAKPRTAYGHPDPLRLGAPLSDMPTHDWTETAQYFDAPPETAACRATFRAVGGAHNFKLGKLWLDAIQIEPVGQPERKQGQRFLVLLMPLDKNAMPPKVMFDEKGAATITHPDGTKDEVAIQPDGKLTVARRQGNDVLTTFSSGKESGTATSLKTNSKASAKQLALGLKPILDRLEQERDAHTSKGSKNLALSAKVTASGMQDERFPPSMVVDNRTAEYPQDGHLDYTQGVVWSSGRFVGYGAGKESLLSDRDSWPLYVRPTYWLLPEEKLGYVELELKEPTAVSLVRLLNTSNAGLNDFATRSFRVELHDRDHKLLASKDGTFGKVFDRPFRQAFVAPAWFQRYTPAFAGLLEPGVTVPFGDGWQEIGFDAVPGVAFVRIVVTKYWGIGGGLNEVQVYGP